MRCLQHSCSCAEDHSLRLYDKLVEAHIEWKFLLQACKLTKQPPRLSAKAPAVFHSERDNRVPVPRVLSALSQWECAGGIYSPPG